MTNSEFRSFYTQTISKLDRLKSRIITLATKVDKDPIHIDSRSFSMDRVGISDTLEAVSTLLDNVETETSNTQPLRELNEKVDELLNTLDLLSTGDAGALLGISDLATYGSPGARGSRWSLLTLTVMIRRAAPWLLGAAVLMLAILYYKKQ